jgi:hypothetical protein
MKTLIIITSFLLIYLIKIFKDVFKLTNKISNEKNQNLLWINKNK